MKKLCVALVALSALLISSCSTVKRTATTEKVDNDLSARNNAELVVSPTKITYTFKPGKAVRRGGEKNVKTTAVAEALKANGNADVLVAPQYEVKKTRGLFGTKIKYVTVTGYPATYKAFPAKACNKECGNSCTKACCKK